MSSAIIVSYRAGGLACTVEQVSGYMHRIMIYLCMIDQMIAEAETKGRAVPQ